MLVEEALQALFIYSAVPLTLPYQTFLVTTSPLIY
jgi:hypothetical protein